MEFVGTFKIPRIKCNDVRDSAAIVHQVKCTHRKVLRCFLFSWFQSQIMGD